MSGLSQRTSRATFWSAAEILARYGVQTVVTILLARLLTPSDFGLLAMLLVFVAVGSMLTDAGFGTALIQRPSVTANDETTVFLFSNCVGLLSAVILYFSAPSIAAFYHQPALVALTHSIAWILPLGALGAVPEALLSKRMDFRARAQVQVLASLVSGGLAIVMALRGLGVWSLVAQALVASGSRSILLLITARWLPRGQFSLESFRALFRFGGFMLLASSLNTISSRLQSLLIGRLFDASSLGFFTLAQNASQVPTSLVGAVLGRVGLPVFSTMSDQPQKLRTALQLSLQVSMFVFFPCMAGIALIAAPLIETFYGIRWVAAAPMLSLLALAGAMWPLHILNLAALSAQGRSDRFLILELWKSVAGILLIVLAAHFGLIAIAAASLAASLWSAVINSWYSKKMLNYGILEQLGDQKIVFLLTTLAVATAWCVLHWMRPGIGSTIIAIAGAGCVYLGGAAAIRYPAWISLLEILRDILKENRKL